MPRPTAEHPTELELSILKILWDKSPLPVRDIRRRLAERGRKLAHTSVITTLGTMFDKKYVTRSQQGNAFYFSPRVGRDDVSRRMLGDLVNRVFDGSAAAVMLRLFECSDIDADDLKELKKLVSQKLKEQKP
jgi:predicted transcriptional regulator